MIIAPGIICVNSSSRPNISLPCHCRRPSRYAPKDASTRVITTVISATSTEWASQLAMGWSWNSCVMAPVLKPFRMSGGGNDSVLLSGWKVLRIIQ